MKKKALVLMPLSPEQKNLFKKYSDFIDFEFCDDCMTSEEQICKAEIIIGNPSVSLLKYAENLEWIQLVTAGADMYLKNNVIGKNVVLTNAGGAYGDAMSEFLLALLLSLYKKLNYYRDNQFKCLWKDMGNEKMLSGSTALIVGFGDIGSKFAEKLKALGVNVIGIRRSGKKQESADEIYSCSEIENIVGRADIISISLPASPETDNLINKKIISKIKKGAVLINTGRGSVLDTDSLCKALEDKQLSGAALDVFEEEPLPASHKLWQMENVIITPHIAGRDFLPHTMNITLEIACENIKSYIGGGELRNLVDRKIYEFPG